MIMKRWNEKGFYRYVLALALPIMLQNGITNLVGLLDNMMIGRIGTEQMSGVSIVNQLLLVYNLAIFGATAGPGIFMSQFHGSGDAEGMRYTFRFKLLACLFMWAAGTAVLLLFGTPLAQAWIHGDGVDDTALTLRSAEEYLRVMLFGLLPFAVKELYASTLRENGETVVPMQASVAAVLINLGLNYVLIFGKLGAPVLGVTGAAIATVISRFAECAIVMLHTHRHADRYPFIRGVYASLRIPGVLTGEMLRKSLPLVLNELLWATSQTMVSRCFAERGLQVVAAYNISSAVTGVSSAIFLAFGSAAAILMGNLLGAGALDDARKTAPRIIRFSALVCAAVGLLQIGLSGLFPQLYNTSADIRDLARWFILINGCFQPFFAVSNSAYFTLRAGGSVFITMVFDSAYEWLVATPAAAALAFLTSCPILGIYLAVLLTQAFKAVLGIVYVRRGKWVRNLTVGAGA